MCSTLKYAKTTEKVGGKIRIYALNTGNTGTAEWSGWATLEKQLWWLQFGVPVHIVADTFIEKDKEFRIPGGILQGIGIKKDVYVGKRLIAPTKTVKLLTRAPMSEYEASIHKRWPVIYYPRDSTTPYEFTEHIGQQQGMF